MIWKNNLKRLRRSYKKPCKYISQIIVFHAFPFQTQNSDTLNTEPFERDEESVWPRDATNQSADCSEPLFRLPFCSRVYHCVCCVLSPLSAPAMVLLFHCAYERGSQFTGDLKPLRRVAFEDLPCGNREGDTVSWWGLLTFLIARLR